MKILGNENFREEYNEIIAPFCAQYEQSGYYKSADGKNLHYLCWKNPQAKANILAVHGFTECAKKLDEMAYYLWSLGYSVYAPDLRGHGLSYKDKAPQYGVDSFGFDFYADDLAVFARDVIGGELPLYAFTHSLGGNAVLLSIMSKGLEVERLVLSSPMICGNMGMPVPVAAALATIITKIGLGSTPAPGKCVFAPEKGNADALSKERGDFWLDFKAKNKDYQTCGPTFRWVMHSVNACKALLDESNIAGVGCEMLVIKPQNDAQLLEKPQDEFIAKCKKLGKRIDCVRLENTHHEIFQSESDALGKYVDIISRFLA